MKPSRSRKGIPNKASLVARDEMIRRGVDPIAMLVEVYNKSMKAFDEGRGNGEKVDSGSSYLSTAGAAAKTLMEYFAPKLSAVAVHISGSEDDAKNQTPVDARSVVLNDPFFKHSARVAEIASNPVSDSIVAPVLPLGTKTDG